MARAPLKETVFSTTANDSLRTVDAYGADAIKESAIPELLLPSEDETTIGVPNVGTVGETPPEAPEGASREEAKAAKVEAASNTKVAAEKQKKATAKAHTKAVLASPLSPADKLAHLSDDAGVADVLSTGASDGQLAAKLDAPLPPNVDAFEFFVNTKGLPFGDVNKALSATKGGLPGATYANLMTSDLTTYVGEALKFIDAAGLNALLCPGEMLNGFHIDWGLNIAGLMIDIRKYVGCNKGKPDINLDGIGDAYKPTAVRSLLSAAADVGAHDVISDIMGSTGDVSHTPGFKKEITSKMLGNYKHKPMASKEDNAANGTSLVDALVSVDSNWNGHDRNGEASTDLTALASASDDALDVLEADPRTEQDAIMAREISVKPATANDMSNEKYPYLQVA